MENAGFEKSKYYKKEEIEMEPIKLQNQQDDKDSTISSTSTAVNLDVPVIAATKKKLPPGVMCMKFLRKHPCGLLVCCPLYAAYILALPIAMIAVGSTYYYDCPREKYLPLLLILGGVPGIIKGVLNVYLWIKSYRYHTAFDDSGTVHLQLFPMSIEFHFESGFLMFILFVCDLYLLIWFFAGAIVVYSMDVRTKQSAAAWDPPCNATLYEMSFWVVTSMIFLTILSCGINFCWRKDEET